MKREQVRELHYITPIVNVPSILELGILSHRRAEAVRHHSIAMQEVQDLRAGVRLPNGRMLHEHVNLYFDARNPMMYLRQDQHQTFVVLRVDSSVLDIPNVIISDGNAARRFGTRFASPDEEGFALLDEEKVYSDYWTHPDPAVKDELKRIRCAEVLVPDQVSPAYITGVYCSCYTSKIHLAALGCTLGITGNEHLFFQGPRRQE